MAGTYSIDPTTGMLLFDSGDGTGPIKIAPTGSVNAQRLNAMGVVQQDFGGGNYGPLAEEPSEGGGGRGGAPGAAEKRVQMKPLGRIEAQTGVPAYAMPAAGQISGGVRPASARERAQTPAQSSAEITAQPEDQAPPDEGEYTDLNEQDVDVSALMGQQPYRPPPRRVTVIPGGMTKTGIQTERTIGGRPDPALERLGDEVASMGIGDINLMQDTITKGSTLQTRQKQKVLDAVAQGNLERSQRRIAIDSEQKKREVARDQAVDAAKQAAVNPNAFLKDAPTWKKALAAISAALVGYAGGMHAQPGAGIQMLMGVWKKHNDEMQTRYENAKDFANAANERYKEHLKLYGTPEEAKEALLIQDLALSEGYVDLAMQQTNDAVQLAALESLKTDLIRERVARAAGLSERDGVRVQETFQNLPPKVIGGGKAPALDERTVWIPGTSSKGIATSGTNARSIQQRLNASYDLQSKAREMMSLIDKPGARDPGSAVNARIRALATDFAFVYKDYRTAGAYDQGLQNAMERVVVDPAALVQIRDRKGSLKAAYDIGHNGYLNILRTEVYRSDEEPYPILGPEVGQ